MKFIVLHKSTEIYVFNLKYLVSSEFLYIKGVLKGARVIMNGANNGGPFILNEDEAKIFRDFLISKSVDLPPRLYHTNDDCPF